SHMKMRRHGLVSRDRLEAISPSECQRAVNRVRCRVRTHIEIHRHPLPGARPRALQREVLMPILRTSRLVRDALLALGLTNAKRKRRGAVFAIPVVAKV